MINSVVGKVYNSIQCLRLEDYAKKHNLLPDTQIGFKKGSQTVDHVFVLQNLIEKYIDRKIFVAFIDFEKAYDSVWWKALLTKVLRLNIRGLFYHQIKSMYKNVLICVKNQNIISKFFESHKGQKQGGTISPLLFNIFTPRLF